ncbi:S4 domain-containing protein [Sphingomonas sp.]|uniref:S4 domain-containing protein n=1 Tax=Sphingomonas sp. TaxID=28214 RepID=UPI001DF025A9|nr:S4 domain-containing protein [Sphingomonas sp.]MBX9795307.1 RNA-binding S4 domain-containing protein [Sphingomonas sp.]
MRLDRFLWFARLARTRALAQGMAQSGQLRLDGRRVERAHLPVRIGSVIAMARGGRVEVVQVAALPVRRGPPAEARACYTMLTGIDGQAGPQ